MGGDAEAQAEGDGKGVMFYQPPQRGRCQQSYQGEDRHEPGGNGSAVGIGRQEGRQDGRQLELQKGAESTDADAQQGHRPAGPLNRGQ